MKTVTVGIMASSIESAAALRAQVRGTGLGVVSVEVTAYCSSRSDVPARRMSEARPDVILIAAEEAASAVEPVQILRALVPGASILVCTAATDTHAILEIVRAGARELIPAPITQESLAAALRRHIDERNREGKSPASVQGRVYSICAAKRGSGATTLAINIAAALAELPNSRVALIDLDWPLGDAAAYLNIKPRFVVSHVLSSAERLDSVLLETFMHSHEGIHVLAGLEDFGPGNVLAPGSVSQLLDVLGATYTYSVIDLPLSLPRDVLETVIRMSQNILAVLTPDLPALRRTERLLRFLGGLDASEKLRLVLNRVRKSDEITDRDVTNALKHPVSWKIGNDYRACMDAINSGHSLLAASNKYLARDFRELARQLAGLQPDKRRGLLSLLPKTSFDL